MANFPSGSFFIQSRCSHRMVIDVAGESLKSTAKIVVTPRRSENFDSQLWLYDDGYLINKNSGLVLDVCGGNMESDKQMIQYRRKMIEDAHNQRWFYREDGFIYPQVDPDLVLDIRGNWTKPGSPILLYQRKLTDNENQLWDLIPLDEKQERYSADSDGSSSEFEDYSFSTSSYAL